MTQGGQIALSVAHLSARIMFKITLSMVLFNGEADDEQSFFCPNSLTETHIHHIADIPFIFQPE